MPQDIHYMVCKMLSWDHFAVIVNGVEQPIPFEDVEPIVGFIPVYANMIDAQTEAGGLDIIALRIKDGAFHKHEEGEPDDGDDTEES